MDISLRFKFAQKYSTEPNAKFTSGSKFPKLSIHYKKGISGFLGSDVNFDYLEIGINGRVKMGLFGGSNYKLAVGKYFSNEEMSFIDFKHFSGNKTVFSTQRLRAFNLLPYYKYSTDHSFGEAHYEHHFNGFLFNKIPGIRKLKLQLVTGLHFLYTKERKQYIEINLGIEHIVKVGRVDFVMGWNENGKLRMGGVVGFGF
jgi:hypothetical protein